jgi:NADPH-dependent ferric siderophore reductase
MARITLTDRDFAAFRSDAYDDHVKLFFAPPGQVLPRPVAGPRGLDFPDGFTPEGRDYTPRSFDPAREELVIDFVLHGDGPVASWAATAKPGDTVGVGGPRASFVLRGRFDWYLLAGDETALPAIGRRIEELPKGTTILAFIEVADAAERQTFTRPATVNWVLRSEGSSLLDALRNAQLPPGQGYAFVAGESAASVGIREHLTRVRGMNTDHVKAAGYWRRGEANFYDGHQH